MSYISGPLATFLDALSLELAPRRNPHAHVTVLPPRPHSNNLKETIALLQERLQGSGSFRVEIGEIEIFPVSQVIYLGIGAGAEQLHEIYHRLNCDCLEFCDTFPYHPHVTLAQDLSEAESARAAGLAKERWESYAGPRGFDVSALSFVQHVAPSIWVDVAALELD